MSRYFEGEDLGDVAAGPYTNRVRDALVETLFASGSNILILPIQDIFGWAERINQPGTVGDGNWTWKLPWPVDRLVTEPPAIDRANNLRLWSETYGR
jgi:4-alpha-glucanotransferase